MLFDFIKNHYELIGSILLILVSFILTLVKKKPVINFLDQIKVFICENVPKLINKVESPGGGPTKKASVLVAIKILVLKKFKYYDEDLESFTSQTIEDNLSTPTKK